MPRSNKHNRALQFESLETRKSLTSVAGLEGAAMESQAAEFAATTTSPRHLLLYVAAADAVSIEKELPDQTETEAVDRWIESTSPEA